MDASHALILSDAIKEYLPLEELMHFCASFDVEFDAVHSPTNWFTSFSTKVVKDIEMGNNLLLLRALLDTLTLRARRGVAKTDWERRDYHRDMLGTLESMQELLGAAAVPSEISTPSGSPFTAKSKVREFLSAAKTDVLIVDNWVGPGTLDCLREIGHPVRLLTGDRQDLSTCGFARTFREFRSEGHSVLVRQQGQASMRAP